MKRCAFLAVIMWGLALAGCGDTINQVSSSNNKLTIKGATYGLYSTHGSTFTQYSSNGLPLRITTTLSRYWIDGHIEYSGDPQGAIVSMVSDSTIYFPGSNLIPGNKMYIWYDMQQSDVPSFAGHTFDLILIDPHGNDSNTFPMTLAP